MRASKPTKQGNTWHHVALFAGLGLFALWSLSLFDVPRLSPSDVTPATVRAHDRTSEQVVGVIHSTASEKRLLMSTHNRLFWYYPETDEEVPLHSGQVTSVNWKCQGQCFQGSPRSFLQGVYYGAFPGDPDSSGAPTVWVVSRPHNWHPQTVEEKLLNINMESGNVVSEVKIPSRHASPVQMGSGMPNDLGPPRHDSPPSP